MVLLFRCVKIRRIDGEQPKRNEAGGTIRDGQDRVVMEPTSIYTVELVPLPNEIWGDHPPVGKLELSRIKSADDFVVGGNYSIEIGRI